MILGRQLSEKISFSKRIAPTNNLLRWISAARICLPGRFSLLESVLSALDSIKEQMATKSNEPDGRVSGIVTANDFDDMLAAECTMMTMSDRQRVI